MTDSCANKLKKERKKITKLRNFKAKCLKCEGEEEEKKLSFHIFDERSDKFTQKANHRLQSCGTDVNEC